MATPGTPSCLFAGHGPARWGFFRAAAVPQELGSAAGGIGVPFGCGGGAGIVVTDEVDESEEIDEEELAR